MPDVLGVKPVLLEGSPWKVAEIESVVAMFVAVPPEVVIVAEAQAAGAIWLAAMAAVP
jgi:hypothetical protein